MLANQNGAALTLCGEQSGLIVSVDSSGRRRLIRPTGYGLSFMAVHTPESTPKAFEKTSPACGT